VADGRLSEGSRSSQRGPRTPEGPSDSMIDPSSIAGMDAVDQKSCPVRRRTFSSKVSWPTSLPSSSSLAPPLSASAPDFVNSSRRCIGVLSHADVAARDAALHGRRKGPTRAA
jgi:hypothetical protein